MSDQQQSVTLGEVYRICKDIKADMEDYRKTQIDHGQRIAVLEERSPGGISAVVSAAVSGVITGLGWLVGGR